MININNFLKSIKDKINEIYVRRQETILIQQKINEEYQHHLNEMKTGANLPNDPICTILLQKDEICHLCCDAQRYEEKVMNTGYSKGYGDISIRITKRITLHSGGTKGHTVNKNVGIKYPGELYITNKRIIFIAEKKNFSISYKNLLSFTDNKYGITLKVENASYTLLLNNVKYVDAVLKGAINKYVNKS
jgi:hypothetical protein